MIFLDDSTTAGAIAPFLNEIDPLTVISNSVAVANALVGHVQGRGLRLEDEQRPAHLRGQAHLWSVGENSRHT